MDLAGVGDEVVRDCVGADEVGIDGPAFGVIGKVAEENVDEECGFNGSLQDADVGDPFLVRSLLQNA